MALSIRDTEQHPPLWGGFLIGRIGDVRLEAPQSELEPEPEFPEPWAWYRSDDIAHFGNGNEVDLWIDRTGNGYDLVPAGSGSILPYFGADALDGYGALRHPGGFGVRSLQWDIGQGPPEPFPNDGFTVVQVHEDSHGYTMQCILGFGQVSGAELYTDVSSGWRGEFLITGFAGAGSAEPGFAGWQALMGEMGPDLVGIYTNGVEWDYGGDGYHVPATQGEWDAVNWDIQFILIDPGWSDTGVIEYIIWDHVFNEDERKAAWTYISDRYPSLGVVA